MDITAFKNNFDKFLLNEFGKIYTSKMYLYEIPDDDMFIYKLKLDLNNHDKPMVFSKQCYTQEEFEKFVFDDIALNRVYITEYFRLYDRREQVKMNNNIDNPKHKEKETTNIIQGSPINPFLFGTSTIDLNEEQIYQNLQKDIEMKSNRYTINANHEYIYFAYPETKGRLQSIVQNTFNVIGAFQISIKLINNISYYVYRSFDKTSAFNQEFIINYGSTI